MKTKSTQSDLNHHYLKKIKEFPLLDLEEEYTLAKKWRDSQDQESANKLIHSHLRLVMKIAQGYRGYGLPLSELIAEGNIGVIQALKHYDPDRGFRLSTYAMWWIRATIQDYIMKVWSLVKIGTNADQKKLFFNLRKLKAKEPGWNEHLTPEKIKDIASKLNVSHHEVVHMHQRMSQVGDFSLNSPIKAAENESSEWINWIEDERDNPEHHVVSLDEIKKKRNLVDQAMQSLSQREHEIFMKRRLKEPPETLEQLSLEYDVSRERIRQIENKAFEKIKGEIKRITPLNFHH